jgi:hypothetical protein
MRSKRSTELVLAVLTFVLLLAPFALADSSTVSYQGTLRNADGSPVADGSYPMTFSIYDAITGGTQRWTENHPAVPTNSGLFAVQLGETTALGVLFSSYGSLWLEIQANVSGSMETYSPRVSLSSMPYAKQAEDTDKLDGQHSSALSPLATIITVYIGIAGGPSIADMQANGWALCDGTTPASQGISGAAITAAMPDLNNTGKFLRGGTTAGIMQAESIGAHNHPASFTGNPTGSGGTHSHTMSGNTSANSLEVKLCGPGSGVNQGRWNLDIGAKWGPYGAQSAWPGSMGGGIQNFLRMYSNTNGTDDTHFHTYNGSTSSDTGHTHTASGSVAVNNNSGTENRPANMSIVYFMKVK